ncbi:hypothetical protein ACFE04_020973 [Oxalis oulophora]
MCTVEYAGRNGWEVSEPENTFVVNLASRQCTCRIWELQGIPCRHAIAVLNEKDLPPEMYVSHWYKSDLNRELYDYLPEPQRGKEDWPISSERELAGPPPRIKRGRPRQKRIPEVGEENGSTNASRAGHRKMAVDMSLADVLIKVLMFLLVQGLVYLILSNSSDIFSKEKASTALSFKQARSFSIGRILAAISDVPAASSGSDRFSIYDEAELIN